MATEQEKRDLILSAFRAGKSPAIISKLFSGIVSKVTVYRSIKAFKETGKTSRKVQVRNKPVRTKPMKKRIREKLRTNPTRSIRQMAKEEAVSTTSMWRLVRKDLGMFPFKKRTRQVLSEATKKKRLLRGKEILQHLRQDRSPPVLWTDEKIFTVQAIHNSQNDRVLAKDKSDIPVELRTSFRRQKPPSVMVWAGVTTDGKKTPLVFVEENTKVDQCVYLHILGEEVLPWVAENYGDGPLVFQQDGAPSHTANLVQDYCQSMFSDFWPKDLWPPSSPDLNPMDFGI